MSSNNKSNRKLLVCKRCELTDGESETPTYEGKRCRWCAGSSKEGGEVYDCDGGIIVERKNRDGELLAQCCLYCCPTKHGRVSRGIDAKDRIELLEGQVKELGGKIQQALMPQVSEEFCKGLERKAKRLLRAARRKRERLRLIVRDRDKLISEMEKKEYEIYLLRILIGGKKRYKKSEVEKTVEAFVAMQRKKREERKQDE